MLDKNSLHFTYLETLRLYHYRTQILLDEIGIYPGQPPLLFLLNKKEGRSQKELADMLRIAPATLTVMLRRMEKAGLVERKQDEKDQRILRVYLTEKGRVMTKKAKGVIREIEKDCFGNFNEEEKEKLQELLNKMRANLEEVNKKRGR